MKTTPIILVLLIMLTNAGLSQLTFSQYGYAYTNGDYDGFDGYAEDGCSTAQIDPYFPIFMELSAQDCDCGSTIEGIPFVSLYQRNEILNAPINNFPTSSYLDYSIPFGFKMELEIDNYNTMYTHQLDYTYSYGADFLSFQTTDSYSPAMGISNLTFSSAENLILPKGNSADEIQLELLNSNCGDPTIQISATIEEKVILLPSQFYIDNAITAPSTRVISGYTFNAETVCANNMYLGNVALDSYHYGTAGNMYIDAEVINGANVSISGGTSITFGPGFSVDSSSSFSTTTYVGCSP